MNAKYDQIFESWVNGNISWAKQEIRKINFAKMLSYLFVSKNFGHESIHRFIDSMAK
jgi:hypothetical protein